MALSKPKLAILVGLSAFPVLFFVGLKLLGTPRKLPGIGEPCTNGVFCASGECIPREPAKQKPGLMDYEMPEPNTPGVCTVPCSKDDGCPTEMRCADIISRPMFPGVTTVKDEPGKPPGRCVPRDWN